MKKGFTCSCFDLMHPGHIKMLQDARNQCDYLIVGLQEDPTIDRPDTKNKPIQTMEERYIMLCAVRFVDEVVLYKTEDDLYKYLKENKPDIRILGSDYDIPDKKFTGDDLDIDIYYHKRDHNWSSTEMRQRIIKSEKKA